MGGRVRFNWWMKIIFFSKYTKVSFQEIQKWTSPNIDLERKVYLTEKEEILASFNPI